MSDYGDLAQWADPTAISTLTADTVGDDVGSSSCLDQCWKDFYECIKSATDGGLSCLAALNTCRRNCGS
jgi:hypothetical protein